MFSRLPCLTLFFSAILAQLLIVSAAPAPGFNVGTGVGADDVVSNGVVKNAWSVFYLPPALNATIQLPQFYFWVNTNGPAYTVYNISLHSDSTDPLHPTTFLMSSTDQSLNTIQQGVTHSKLYTVDLTCIRDGQWIGYIEINFIGTTNTYDPITISFNKFCKFPSVDVGSHSTAGYLADVIQNSLPPYPQWNFTYPPEDASVTFFIWLDPSNDFSDIPSQPFFPVIDFDHSVMFLEPQIVGGAVASALTPLGTPSALQITFNCISNTATSTSKVTVSLNVYWDKQITFTFEKTCAGGQSPRQGLNVGRSNLGTDVVVNGAPTVAFSTFPGPMFGPGYQSLAFYASLAHTTGFSDTQFIEFNYTSLSVPPVFNLIPPRNYGPQLITVNNSIVTETQYICRTSGLGSMKALIYVLPFDTIELVYEFRCTRPLLTVSVNASADPTLTMIDQSTTTDSGLNARYVAGVSETTTTFYISLKSSPNDVSSQNFDINFEAFTPSAVVPSLSVSSNVATSTASAFTVSYQCNPELTSPINGPTPTKVSLSLNYGWTTVPVFTWTKLCPSTFVPVTDDSSSSAWSPAGIFFFTLFILLLALFIAKYLYNYFSLHERGTDAIPGIEYMRRFGAWVSGSTDRGSSQHHYGPQDDERTEALSGGHGYGSASYQTDHL